MPLSWNDIRERATRFSHDWKGTKSEDADASKLKLDTDAQRVAFLFTLYAHMTSLFGATAVDATA